jgi:chemotaxis protein CheD
MEKTVVSQLGKETIISAGQMYISKSSRELIKASRIATSIVVVVYDLSSHIGGIIHMAMPDSKVAFTPGDSPNNYVDLALPPFIKELLSRGLSPLSASIKIIGGAQLFNFGGGSGNILNIGTRNAITVRTILTREGLQVEKTETGGNKPRTVLLDMHNGEVQVYSPGETPRFI